MNHHCVFQTIESDVPERYQFRCVLCEYVHTTKKDKPPVKDCPEGQFDCRHRGEVLRQEPCNTCATGRGTPTDVYECAIHGECVKRQHRTPASMMDCVRCIGAELGFKKRIRLGSESYEIILPIEDVEPKRNRAIVTAAFGSEHLEILDMTRPARQEYAERCGADLIELTDDRFPRWSMANKWRAGMIAGHYDQTLWLDSDVLIMPDSPSIFAECGENFGLVDESAIVERNGFKAKYAAEMALLADLFGLPIPDWSPNGGVLLIPRRYSSLYAPPPRCPVNWCLDQHWLALSIEQANADVKRLDWRWNHLWIDPAFWQGLPDAYFVHLNGTKLPARKELCDRILSGNYDPTKLETWEPVRC